MTAMSRSGNGKILSRVKSLAANECVNYQTSGPSGLKHHCLVEEKIKGGVCVFFSEVKSPRCLWFEETVLPLDKNLKAVFSSELLALQVQDSWKRAIRKKCDRCPETFLARSNAQRFCPRCQRAAYRDKSREWDREKRIAQNRAETAPGAFG